MMDFVYILAGVLVGIGLLTALVLSLRRPAMRDTIRNGVMIQEQRGLIFRWRWSFKKSHEDHLTRLLNQRVMAKQQLRNLQRQIPLVEARLAEVKKELAEKHGGTSPVYHDSWSPRREPLQLKEPTGKPKKKDDKPRKQHPDAGVIAKLTSVIPPK